VTVAQRVRATRLGRRLSATSIGWLLIAAAILIHLPTLGQPLVEHQSFRQTTTAFPTLIYHEQGIDLLQPEVPVFGPPYVLPLEFPLFQAAASLLMAVGASADVANRAMALAFFALTALLLWRLLARLAGEPAALAGLAAFLFSPLGLLVSRMALIEYLATAAGIAFVFAGLRWDEDRRWRWFAIAVVAGTIGMLVKATTMVMYLLPVAVLVAAAMWQRRRSLASLPSHVATAAVLLGVPVLMGLGWLVYADGVRAANPGTAWLTASGGLTGYYFGTLQQRLDPSTWWYLIDQAQELLLGRSLWLWVLAGLTAAAMLPRRVLAVALVLSGGVGPLLFTNQYALVGQEYYMAALSPLVAATVGLAAGWLWRQREMLLSKVVMAALVVSWVVTLHLTQGYWGRQFAPFSDPDQILAAADFIAARTQPDEPVALAGQDWNPAVLYYARRKGTVIRNSTGPTLEELRAAGFVRIFSCPPGKGLPDPCEIFDIGAE
jgi:4-amino-4-deoxy-L-arabinose transferase-like glycosyltransferase